MPESIVPVLLTWGPKAKTMKAAFGSLIKKAAKKCVKHMGYGKVYRSGKLIVVSCCACHGPGKWSMTQIAFCEEDIPQMPQELQEFMENEK